MRLLKLFIYTFLFFLITSDSFVASAKDLLIADVYFDDGSVLHNAKFKPKKETERVIEVKHENEIFTLDFEDLKTLEFVVEPGTHPREAKVTLKIKTKTGAVINDRFSTADKGAKLRWQYFCLPRSFSFVNKLTGKEVTKRYGITNLEEKSYSECSLIKRETKGISSIVFKDGIEKKTEKGLTQPTNVPPQGVAQKMPSDLPKKGTKEQNQGYPNTRDLQEAGAAFTLGNYQKAIALFMPLAKQGNPLAQGTLGMMHAKGHGVPQNYQEAIKWYRKAAEQGYPLAQYDLGLAYENGHGVSQDSQMAIKWWTKAAEQNHAFAQYLLGLQYLKNNFEKESVPSGDALIPAYKWVNMAAANGVEKAKKMLNMLREQMTNAQIAEGQRLSEELIKKAKAVSDNFFKQKQK